MILSPAQRRASGQVRRRRRPWSPLRILASAGAAVAIAVLSAVAVVNLMPEPSAVTTLATAAPPTTVFVPTLEGTLIPPPASDLSGAASLRGDEGRTGVVSGGFRNATGRYWGPKSPGGFFVTPPVAFGSFIYVATDERIIHGIKQLNGEIVLSTQSPTEIHSPIAVDLPDGDSDSVLVFGGADQFVHAYSALEDAPELWSHATIGLVEAAPLIVDNNTVFIADTAGYLYALGLAGGELLWQYPSPEDIEINGEPEGAFVSAPAFADGIVYAVNQLGLVHMVDAASGLPVCGPVDLLFEVLVNPVISQETVFVGKSLGSFSVFAAGTCGLPPSEYAAGYPTDRPVRRSPALTPDTMFYIDERRLTAISLDASLWEDIGFGLPSPWESPFSIDQLITTNPVLADGVVYVGTQEGLVLAVDAETGLELWRFSVGAAVRGEPLVVPGAVFVGTADGELWAIAGE